MIRFDFCQHLLKAGTVKVSSTVSIVYEENRIGKTVFPRVLGFRGYIFAAYWLHLLIMLIVI